MPATELRSTKPVTVQHSVVALRAQGESIRKIAKHLSISPVTVSKILKVGQSDTKNNDIAERIVPKAFQVVENGIDAGDTALAMRYLERTALGEQKAPSYAVAGDMHLTQTMALLPAAGAPTEAAAKPPGSDVGLPLQANFSPVQDAVLVPAEPEWCEQSAPEDEEAQW